MAEDTSSYEKLRLENIKRNELFLEKLDLASLKRKPAKVEVQQPRNKRAKIEVSSDHGPIRVSNRNASKAPGFFSEDSLFRMNRRDDDTDEEESTPQPTKRAQRVNRDLAILSDIEELEPVIKMEKAKTGRSSCRKCRENIDQDTMRIGMKAWIMGRSSW